MGPERSYEELCSDECTALLAEGRVGRVAGIVDNQPFIFPVNYTLEDDTVVFRTEPGKKLEGAGFGRVAFEIDGVDEANRTGWSVIVQGVAIEITHALDSYSESLRDLKLEPWVPGDKGHWVAIQADSVTGRRLSES